MMHGQQNIKFYKYVIIIIIIIIILYLKYHYLGVDFYIIFVGRKLKIWRLHHVLYKR